VIKRNTTERGNLKLNNQQQTIDYDPVVGRGEILFGLSHHIEHSTNDIVKAALLRYMDCVIQEQEKMTEQFLNLPGEKIVH